MSKIMTNYDLIDRMKELLNEPNFYGSGGNQWSTWQDGRGWYVDCTCSIKAILWGGRFIQANRGKPHAGCNYGSNGVPDFTPASCVEWTNATRGNFGNLVPGEILLMTSQGHAGLYIGGGNVIEVTPAWTGGTPGCQVSQIGANGERVKNGSRCLTWEWHGFIPVIDYVNPSPTPAPTPTPSGNFNIGDEVILNGPIYTSSDAASPANVIYNKQTQITRKADGAAHPYNTTGDLGWCDESSLTKVEPPKPEPAPKKSNEEIAQEVIEGLWGNYPERKERLEAAGYDYATIQGIVNNMLAPKPTPAGLNVGDTVKIIGLGYSNTYGTGGYNAGGIGWIRTIQKIHRDSNGNLTSYPYKVGLGDSTTGFYRADALEKQ